LWRELVRKLAEWGWEMSECRIAGRDEPGPNLRIVWALCTVARSGSSWLSELVSSTNQLGHPDEYLLNWRDRCEEWGIPRTIDLDRFLSVLMPRKSTPNGVFAIKGSYAELAPFLDRFPHVPCCWLRREDKVQQAVSWYRAHRGGVWTRLSDAAETPVPLRFSLSGILELHREIHRREGLWQQFFLRRQSLPLELTYEQVCQDPVAAVRAIARHVGVDPQRIQHVQSSMRVVRDQRSMRWAARVKQTLDSRSST
jgi:trehalose 2-sulfotransferase